jgi:hypothetical protein
MDGGFGMRKFLVTFAADAKPTFRGLDMEASNAFLMVLGAASLLTSWILLLIASWKEDYAWGMFSFLLPPVGYFYGLFRLDKAGQALGVAVLGWILIWLGW